MTIVVFRIDPGEVGKAVCVSMVSGSSVVLESCAYEVTYQRRKSCIHTGREFKSLPENFFEPFRRFSSAILKDLGIGKCLLATNDQAYTGRT